MASILAARKAHAAAKADNAGKKDDKRKRRRQLGRATSGRSNASTADDIASRTSSAAEGAKRPFFNEENLVEGDVEKGGERDGKQKYVEYQPSQELGWDAPGAQEAREQMIRAMGGKIEDSAVMVSPIGVVRDMVDEGRGRSGRRRRG